LSRMEPIGRLAQGGRAVFGRRLEPPGVQNRPTSDIIVNITTLGQIMDDAISAADANRSFSSLLRRVREGRSVVVTSHGKPIARIVPLSEQDDRAAEGARAALLARLRAEPVVSVGRWMRHELYED
jgi:prevent-host-death family protein